MIKNKKTDKIPLQFAKIPEPTLLELFWKGLRGRIVDCFRVLFRRKKYVCSVSSKWLWEHQEEQKNKNYWEGLLYD